jgi:TPR repeat protein
MLSFLIPNVNCFLTEVRKDEALASEYYQLAANTGHAEALAEVNRLIKKDRRRAKRNRA